MFRALKAPAAARALPKLADRARTEDWSFEQFAAHAAQDRGRQPRQPRWPEPNQGRPAPRPQDTRGLRLRLPEPRCAATRCCTSASSTSSPAARTSSCSARQKGRRPSRRPWPQGGGGFQFLRPTQCVSARAPSQRYAWPVPGAGVPPRRVAARRCARRACAWRASTTRQERSFCLIAIAMVLKLPRRESSAA